ncbi:MAG: hypothetical protein Q7K34_03420 [archaeon]|nr:hypothetical protein [archaeon]
MITFFSAGGDFGEALRAVDGLIERTRQRLAKELKEGYPKEMVHDERIHLDRLIREKHLLLGLKKKPGALETRKAVRMKIKALLSKLKTQPEVQADPRIRFGAFLREHGLTPNLSDLKNKIAADHKLISLYRGLIEESEKTNAMSHKERTELEKEIKQQGRFVELLQELPIMNPARKEWFIEFSTRHSPRS